MARILLVDDDAAVLDALARLLELDGHRALAAPTGGDALVLAGSERPDMVLLDQALGDFSGLETLRLLQERWPALPVVLMSGLVVSELVIEATQLGAVDFLPKPIDGAALRATVSRALGGTAWAPAESEP